MSIPPGKNIISILLFLLVSVCWGGSYVAITVGLEYAPPIFLAALRLYIAGVVVFLVAVFRKTRLWPKGITEWIQVLISGGFATGISTGFLIYGQQFTTSAVAAVIFAMNPIIATAFAWVLVAEERIGPVELIGIGFGFVGVLVIANPDVGELLAPSTVGNWIILGGASGLAFGTVMLQRIRSGLSITVILGWGLVTGAIGLHLCSFVLGEPQLAVWDPSFLLAVTYLGVPGTAIAFIGYYQLLEIAGSIRTTLVSYVVPVITAITAWILLGEVISVQTVVGFVVIAIGFFLTEHRRIRDAV